jgi:hypothetical protein
MLTKQKGSSRGLVVKAEDLYLKGCEFEPSLWRPFFRNHSFGSKLGTKFVENSNLALLHMMTYENVENGIRKKCRKWKTNLLQNVENCFIQLGQNAKNDVHNTLRLYFCEKCLKEIKIGIQV